MYIVRILLETINVLLKYYTSIPLQLNGDEHSISVHL